LGSDHKKPFRSCAIVLIVALPMPELLAVVLEGRSAAFQDGKFPAQPEPAARRDANRGSDC